VSLTVASWAWRRDHASSWYFQWQAHTGNNYESDGLYGVMLFLRFWCVRAEALNRAQLSGR